MALADIPLESFGEPELDQVHLYEMPPIDDQERSFFDSQRFPANFVYLGDVPTPRADRWPDQFFEFSDTKMIGNKVVLATPESRFVGFMEAVTENPDNAAAFYLPEGQNLSRSLQVVKKHLKAKFTFNGEKIPRQSLLPPNVVAATIEEVWKAENNPLLQALRQARKQYREELGDPDFLRLARDVIFASRQTDIMQMYLSHRRNAERLVKAAEFSIAQWAQ